MSRNALWRPRLPVIGRGIAKLAVLLSMVVFLAPAAWAQDNDATKILKAMRNTLPGTKIIPSCAGLPGQAA